MVPTFALFYLLNIVYVGCVNGNSLVNELDTANTKNWLGFDIGPFLKALGGLQESSVTVRTLGGHNFLQYTLPFLQLNVKKNAARYRKK